MNKKFIHMLITIVILMGTGVSGAERMKNAGTEGRCPEREELHKWGQQFHVCNYEEWTTDCIHAQSSFTLKLNGSVIGGPYGSIPMHGSATFGTKGWRVDNNNNSGDSWTYYQLLKSKNLDGPNPQCTYTVCSSDEPCDNSGACIDKPCDPDWILGQIILSPKVSCEGKPNTQGCCNGKPCYPPYVCTENKCCPEGSSSKLCGGECCSEDSICLKGKCTPCGQGTKSCNCPPGKKNCTPSCIPEGDRCKNGVRVCHSGDILCGDECMNPLDRICKNGKIKTCPDNQVVKNNICTPCPENNIIRDSKCQACPSGQVSVNNNCHLCINNLECKYSWKWDVNGTCFSAVHATLSDGTVVNVSKKQDESVSQKCCYDLVTAVQGFTSPFVCPGYGPQEWTQNPNYTCTPGSCSSPPSNLKACERKCFSSCKHNLNLAVVAACYWVCFAGCELESKGKDKSDEEDKKE